MPWLKPRPTKHQPSDSLDHSLFGEQERALQVAAFTSNFIHDPLALAHDALRLGPFRILFLKLLKHAVRSLQRFGKRLYFTRACGRGRLL
jgi:hypothetical protein